jgi:hypothetical protein
MRPFIRFWTIAGVLAAILPAIAFPQTVEDFACAVPVSVTAANPAVVACPSPHGYNMRAVAILAIYGNPANNGTVTIDGTAYTFVSALNNATPNQVLIGLGTRETAWNLYHAVNDDGFQKGVLYSNATTAHPTFTAATSFQSRYVYFYYRTPGASGIGKAVASSDAVNFPFDTSTTRMEWNVMIAGGTGGWASIGTTASPRSFYARYVDATHYALYATETYGYDATANGSFTGQSLFISPGAPTGDYYPKTAVSESWSLFGWAGTDGLYHMVIPGCANPAHELECSQSIDDPEVIQNGVSTWQTTSAFNIASGVGTITFSSAFPYTAGGSENMLAGSVIFLRNFKDTADTWTHTITAANESTGTLANHLVKYTPGANTVRGPQFRDSGSPTGGVIGVCISGCGTSGTATIADAGLMACSFDNAYTAGHWVTPTGYNDQCHDAGANFPNTIQPLGIVQSSGSANTVANIWWNGLNRAFVVQSINGPANGSNVTQITIHVPGYADGSYNVSSALPNLSYFYGAPRSNTAFVATFFKVTPYLIYPAAWAGGYQYPLFSAFMKDQTNFNPATTNHLNFWVKWNKPQKQCGIDSGALSIGTYFEWPGEPAEQGSHYYNQGDPEIYSGWMKYTINLAPSHQVGINTPYNYPSDLMSQGSALGWHGSAHYFDRMGTFYQDLSGIFCPSVPSPNRDVTGQTILISPVTLESATGEPEELVRARTGQWAQSLYKAGDADHAPSGNPGYSLSWAAPLNGVAVQYEVRYSTVGSLKTYGFSTGLCQNGTTTCGAADRVSGDGAMEAVLYKSGTLGQQANIWWAIKPISIPVAGVSGSGQNPTWLIAPVDPGFAAGDHVTISGVGGNTAANQTNIASTAFQARRTWTRFDPTPWPLPVEGYPANAGGPVKITITDHNLLTGQTIMLGNATGTGLSGQYTVTVIDANTFTLNGSSYNTACPCSGGKARLNLPGTMVSITSNSTPSPNTVCTANFPSAHGLVAGWKFDIMGAPDSHLSNSDGITSSTYTVTNVGSSTSFDFLCPANTPTGATFNTDNPSGTPFMIQSWPGVAIPVTGNGAYTSGGSIFSTEDKRNFAEIQLTPYNAAPSPLSQRFGGANTSTAAILLYQAPDSTSCSITLSGTGAGTGSMNDSGGERSRLQVWSGLSASTMYLFIVSCAQGSYYASGSFTTMAAPSPSSVPVMVSGMAPANAGTADNLVVDYGSTASVQDGSANAACIPGTRCAASFTRSLDCMVWVRRRWCRNRASDPTCSNAANEVARSTAEAITVH